MKYDNIQQTYTLTFEKIEKTEKAYLDLVFNGHLNNQMNGFYRSSYVDEKGNKKYTPVQL